MSRSLIGQVCVVVACACAALMLCGRAGAVVNGVEPELTDRRFDGVGLFFTVGTAAQDTGCAGLVSGTCILIAPDTVLIARHCLNVGATDLIPNAAVNKFRVRFRRAEDGRAENRMQVNGNSCHGVYQERLVRQLVDAPTVGSDMAIGYLDSPVEMIQPIGMEITNPPTRVMNVVLAGWGYAGNCFATGEHWSLRYARGRTPDNTALSDWLVFSSCSVGSVAPCMTCFGSGPYATANLHDSGGAVFVEVPSADPSDPTPELRLVATVASTSTAHRPGAWNRAGGQPALAQAPVRRPHYSVADYDADGSVTVDDLFRYLTGYFMDAPTTDCNRDRRISIEDLLQFVSAFMNAR